MLDQHQLDQHQLDQHQLDLINRSVLCWLATVSEDHQPSVSPKELWHAASDHIVIANVMSPNSARNLRVQPRACVGFLDVFAQKGVQVYGEGEAVADTDPRFGRVAERVLAAAGDDFPFRSVFVIRVREAKPIVAPRYRLFPETTEVEQVASALETYGVRALLAAGGVEGR